ncbi:hypothetical protein GYMLUDRAFT_204971 [Collybiopsis luxurians FD-317 M1]|uniref:GIT Spa2 homology (SHD) domain-containing protein n=1 Tax=Collybiopsis luxurians FD-317 M1 TaxID=944289 RepID=A0A0D0BMJ5_9AGAR|nr:hypothetical protein GYMLUDRAFT_204971 [Collybiopsis luxurians FD-317 M1]
MKHSSQPRAPSPNITVFSGISNHRTESSGPWPKNPPLAPQIDYRSTFKVHFDEFSQYLAAYSARSAPNSRSTARQKLIRLTIQQFHELSTDVYDELIRRKSEKEVPFLPVRDEFKPKRNQARQKLATLPTSRFEDLSSDVYFELSRRYPEFKEELTGRASAGFDQDPITTTIQHLGIRHRSTTISRTSGRTSADRPSDSGYDGSVSSQGPSDTERIRISDDNHATRISPHRKSSQDTPQKSEDREREYGRQPSAAARESGSSINDERERSRDRGPDMFTDEEPDSASNYASLMTPTDSPTAGLSGLIARLNADEDTDSPAAGLNGLIARLNADEDDEIPSARSGDDFFEKVSYGRNSANSDRSINALSNRLGGGRASLSEDIEKMRRNYEFKIANQVTVDPNVLSILQEILDDPNSASLMENMTWMQRLSASRDETLLQELADVVQSTLDTLLYSDTLISKENLSKETVNRRCLRALRYLSNTYHVLPSSLTITEIKKNANNPVAGGGFADIWPGNAGDQAVCLKVLRLVIEPDETKRKDIRREILTLQLPFYNQKSDYSVVACLMTGKRPARPESVWCQDAIWDLITHCWAQNPANRPNAQEVYEALNNT